MYDFHVHISLNSGTTTGGLLPAEAMQLGRELGYRGLVLTLRADSADLGINVPALARSVQETALYIGIEAVLGLELVHVPPQLLVDRVHEARCKGFAFLIAHGESLADTVAQGTNLAAIEAGVDLLAHPGLLRPEEVQLAAEKKVALELSSCPRHALSNGFLVKTATAHGATLLHGGNIHNRTDMLPAALLPLTYKGAGLDSEGTHEMQRCGQTTMAALIMPPKYAH